MRYFCRQKMMAVICYHRVRQKTVHDRMSIGMEELEQHLRIITESKILAGVSAAHFEKIWTGEAANDGRIPLLITFDDGYRDNLTLAAPLLQKYGLPALLFIATDILENRPLWYDLIRSILRQKGSLFLQTELAAFLPPEVKVPQNFSGWVAVLKELKSSEFRAVSAHLREIAPPLSPENEYFSVANVRNWVGMGLEIGCHTCSHPRLSRIDREEARTEIRTSREILEKITGQPVRFFAYPFGEKDDFSRQNAVDLRELGISMGFSLLCGSNRAGADPFLVRRNCIDSMAGRSLLRKISPSSLHVAMLGLTSDVKRLTCWPCERQMTLRPQPTTAL